MFIKFLVVAYPTKVKSNQNAFVDKKKVIKCTIGYIIIKEKHKSIQIKM